MKKFLQFLSVCMILFVACSCGTATDPNANITFQQAFSHCLTITSYITFAIIGTIIGVGSIIGSAISNKNQGGSGKTVALFAVGIIIIACVWLIRPCEVAANTTVEQANRGVWIGW